MMLLSIPGNTLANIVSLYRDKECRKGGFPMQSPNPHANDLEAAKKIGRKEQRVSRLSLGKTLKHG